MNAARQLLRASTRSLSSASASYARPALHVSTRQYSDKAPPPAEEQKADEQKSDKDTPQVSLEELQTKLKAKEDEVVDLTSRLRYLQADFLNLQRNAAREKEQQRDFAISRFAADLLETVDVLSLALKSVPDSALSSQPAADSSAPEKTPQEYLIELHHGVEMTHRLLLSTLFKYHVKPFDPTGDVFDPNLHEALYQAPIPGKEPGTVLECQKTGYKIKDRVLRAAQVGVVQDTS
ncbi:GrpE-domain-containing protein [Coniophora puteana RWD-64-598 SS2]|uniref:GrpE protein homolog n=1 Tax=Coniophora puteana (strain RWD-64-598) TaxID=741705 RepID=A0A5M3N1D5_CONPW|nr:GrpE-domain-containing protein [Coniophora puteana RWD-64-598 SS2]EIW85188.1 GrpE-domain-containing protein [Coniophora puteana RWD-64-598 SS2]